MNFRTDVRHEGGCLKAVTPTNTANTKHELSMVESADLLGFESKPEEEN